MFVLQPPPAKTLRVSEQASIPHSFFITTNIIIFSASVDDDSKTAYDANPHQPSTSKFKKRANKEEEDDDCVIVDDDDCIVVAEVYKI